MLVEDNQLAAAATVLLMLLLLLLLFHLSSLYPGTGIKKKKSHFSLFE